MKSSSIPYSSDRTPSTRNCFGSRCCCASQFYGRKGAAIEVISGIDLALWDLVGQGGQTAVYNLAGGKTKEKIPVYVTGNLTQRHLAEGFRHVKLALPHGPADGAEGLRQNLVWWSERANGGP